MGRLKIAWVPQAVTLEAVGGNTCQAITKFPTESAANPFRRVY